METIGIARRGALLVFALGMMPAQALAEGPNAVVQVDAAGGGDACQLNTLARNDDGYIVSPVVLPFELNFFSQHYFNVWVNNNGNVTFDGWMNTWSPFPLVGNQRPIVAAFFTDVDTRYYGLPVTYGVGSWGGRRTFCANWVDVAEFSGNGSLNSAQILLVERADVAPGDFDIVLNYDKITWDHGNARAGWSNGAAASYELAGSGVAGAFRDTNVVTGLIHNSLNSTQPGRYLFPVRSGVVLPADTLPPVLTPDPLPVLVRAGTIEVTGVARDDGAGLADGEVRIGGVEFPLTIDAGGHFSAEVPLAEGANGLVLAVRDAAGNEATTTLEVTRDSTPPSLDVEAPIDGSVTGELQALVQARFSDASPTLVRVNGTALQATGGIARGLVDLAVGTNVLRITATDAAGNETERTVGIVADRAAPAVTLSLPDSKLQGPIAGDTLLVDITVDDLTATETRLAGTTHHAALPAGGGTLTFPLELQPGNNTFTLTVTDAAGRTTTRQLTVVYDNEAPQASFSNPANDDVVRGITEFSVEATDAISSIASLEMTIDGGLVALLPAGAGTWAALVQTSELNGDGRHEARAVVVDAAGNASVIQRSFVVDNTAPSVSLETQDVLSGVVHLVAHASDATSGVEEIRFFVGEDEVGRCAGDECSVPLDTATLPDGSTTVRVVARDLAGNEAAQSRTVQVANGFEEHFLVSPAPGQIVSGEVRIRVDSRNPRFDRVECFAGDRSLGVSTDPRFTTTFSTLGVIDGPLTIACKVTDRSGNVAVEEAAITVRNWTVQLDPQTLQLSSKGGANSVTLEVEGANVALLQREVAKLSLAAPGGSIPATIGAASGTIGDPDRDGIPNLTVKFDRQRLAATLRAAMEQGAIAPGELVRIGVVHGVTGHEVGSDAIRVR